MKKYKVIVIMLVTIVCLGSVLIPNALSQLGNVKVLSYSWYVNPSGDFIVVGEVQNTGNFVLSPVSLNAEVYAADGTELASGNTMAYVSYLLPQQKAPFYIDFGNSGTSVTPSVSNVDFTISNAPPTSDQEYEDLSVNTSFNGSLDGTFTIMGFISNIGNQTATGIRVVGTYYNSAGTVVAVGFNNVIGSLIPNNATTFTLSEFDTTPTLAAKISNYSILVQTATLQNNNSPSTISPSPSAPSSIYGVVAPVLIVVVAVTALVFLRKRHSTTLNPPPPPPPPPS